VKLPANGQFARLSPWTGWWDTSVPTLLRVGTDNAEVGGPGEIHLTIRDAGDWVKPRPLTEVFHFNRVWPGSLSEVQHDLDLSRINVLARDGAIILRSSN